MDCDVVVPTFNRPGKLSAALASLQLQTYRPSRVIIVDDGTAVDYWKDLSANFHDLNITFRRNPVSKGANYCRNLGVSMSKADIIFFLDDDDLFDSDKIKKVMEIFEEFIDVDLVVTRFRKFYEDYAFTKNTNKNIPNGIISVKESFIKNILGSTSLVAIKRNRLLDVGGFDENLCALQDKELWLRLSIYGCYVKVTDEILATYRISYSSERISNSIERYKSSLKYIEDKHKDIFYNLSPSETIRYHKNNLQQLCIKSMMNRNRKLAFNFCLQSIHLKLTLIDCALILSMVLPRVLLVRLM